MKVTVFVAHSHHDDKYLRDDSLLGYLRGLERDGVAEFWSDRRIAAGDLWDTEIKAKISSSQIALVLVSEMLLTSAYVQDTEIPLFLKKRREDGMIIFPVILSASDWQAHDWLKSTQFLPRDGKNLESHFTQPGPRKELFLEIKRDLRRQIDRIIGASRELGTPCDQRNDRQGRDRTTDVRTEEEWRNPFDLVTANDLEYEDIPQLFVGEYTDFNKINKHFDTILEGQRGTGKTMILRYMAFETQIKIWTEQEKKNGVEFFRDRKNFVGVYCRLEQGVFNRSDLDAVENADRRERLFEVT